MRKKIINKLKGFTLVEILIGITVSGIIGSIMVGFLSQNTQFFSTQSSKVNQGLELNTTSAEIEEIIKSASGVVSQYPLTGQPQYTTGLNVLIISLPAINAQGTVIANANDYIVIHQDTPNSKILRKNLYKDISSSRNNENTVLSTKLSKIEFRYLDAAGQPISPVQASKIGFIINVAENIATNTQTSSASGQVNLRNN